MTTYLCPRCQGNTEAKPCTLCGGAKRVVRTTPGTAINPARDCEDSLTHLEMWRLDTEMAKAALA